MSYRENLKKSCRNMSASDLTKAPFSVFEGLSNDDVEKMEEVFGIGTIKDMATLKAFNQAHDILVHATGARKTAQDEEPLV